MKLVWCSPTYGPVEPQALKSQRVAQWHAVKHAGVEWIADASPDRIGFAPARNVAVKLALEHAADADALFWCDSDIVLPQEAISRLVLSGKDFITGIYCQRNEPHFPLIALHDAEADTFNWYGAWPENAIAPIDGCGFGCVLTSMTLLKAMPSPWFAYEKFSEDFDFCLKAQRLGFQLFVDTGILCGHLPEPEPITVADFRALRDRGGLAPYGLHGSAA